MPFRKFILFLTFIALLFPVYLMAANKPVKKDFFPEIQGFTKSGDSISYKPETLFEYMDGAAELYLIYDFSGLNLQIYKDKNDNTITAEIYDQQNVNNSFGIYSQERPYECEFIPIGAQANYIEGHLNFYQGRYYVKIIGYNLGAKDKEYLVTEGKILSGLLDEKSALPKMLKTFPDKNKIKNSEEYIAKDFLGYSYFKNVFTAEYENDKTTYKLFIIEEPDRSSLEQSINEYKKQLNSTKDILNGGVHKLDDPYQGEIIISISGNYIVGILNPDSETIDQGILMQAISNLK